MSGRPDTGTVLADALALTAARTTITDSHLAAERLERSMRRNRRRRTALVLGSAAAALVAVAGIGVLASDEGRQAAPQPAETGRPTLPPPGHRIVVAGNPDILVLSDLGGPPVAVMKGTEPRLSPDGRRLAFVDEEQRIAVAKVGEWAPTSLTEPSNTAGGDTYGPIWSPDGAQIAYMVGSDLRMLDTDERQSQLVKSFAAPYVRPMEWRPDGTLLLGFDRTSEGGSMVVERFDPATGRLAPYLGGDGETTGVRLSPDGTQIAFYSDSRLCICIADADGRHIRTVLRFPADDTPDSARLAWSPDGGRVVWDERFTGRVHLLDVTTGEDRLLQDGVSGRAAAIDWDRP